MDGKPEDIVREGYECYSRRDFAGVFELLSPNIVIRQTTELPWGGEFHGLNGARQFFTSLALHTTGGPQPSNYISAGESVAVIGRLVGTVNSTGTQFDLDIVHVWTVEDGKITQFNAYIDTPGMLAALGK